MRHRKRLHGNVADGKLGTRLKDPAIAPFFQETAATERVSGESIAINRQIKFTAEHVKSADVIGVFVREKHAFELLRHDAALLETQRQLPRAQPAVDKNLAMIRRDQRAVPRAPAPEHGQAEHGSQDSRVISICANGIVALGAICALATVIELVILSGAPAKSKDLANPTLDLITRFL